MRPVLLKISAFGSYAREEIIDFSKITSGIFLIAGDTGSGKTTIFDAMTFALYDQASGGKRDTNDMRSQYANADVPTYVEFTFQLKNQTYRIKRNPRYVRESKRRDKDGKVKMTTEAANVELYLPGDVLFTGKMKETNDKIVEIMGINASQFTQICMLAQGDFLKLLHASSGTRREIFQRLFHTEFYEKIEMKLRSMAKQSENKLVENDTLSLHELENIRPFVEGGKAEEWSELKKSFIQSKNHYYLPMEEIERLLEQIETEEQQVFAETEKHLQQLQIVVETRKKLKEKKKEQEDYVTLQTETENYLSNNNPVLADLEKRKEEAEAELKNQEEPLMQMITRLQDAMSEYEKIKLNADSIKKWKTKAETCKSRLDENTLKEITKAAKSEIINLKIEKEAQIKTIEEKQRERVRVEEELKKYRKVQKKLETEKKKAEAAFRAYEEKRDIYEARNDSFMKEQIGIIAKTLKENEACPVCGSLTHPLPAKLVDDFVTEEMVRKARTDRNQAESDLQNQQSSFQKVKLEENTFFTQLEQTGSDLFDDFDMEEAEKICAEAEEKFQILQNNIWNQIQYLECMEQVFLLTQENETLLERLPIKDAEQAMNCLQEKRKLLQNLQDRKHKAEEEYQKLALLLQQKKGILLTVKERIKSLEGMIKELEKKNAEYSTEGQEDKDSLLYQKEKEKREQYFLQLKRNQNATEQIRKLFTVRRKMIQEYEVISKLDKTANGNVAGSIKMDFQTFVQRQYFKQIIAEANRRLIRISNHQFILKCKEIDETGGQGAGGLDLNIYSLVTDTTRDVKTLSGGESFMAALSMALGMSDIITKMTGSIQMETMFVDEGFGTLDEEARAQAIHILQELAGEKRLVGIISHVTELKDQIDRKLVVQKTEKGSSVKWILES